MHRAPTVKFFAANLTIPHTETDILTPNFYTQQTSKLRALLDTVVAESRTVLDAETCIDYLELTGVLTDMVGEAQHYARLSRQELCEREAFVRFFLAKVDTVKGTIADWDARSRRMRRGVCCRKRVRRSVDLRGEAVAMVKRRREETCSEAERMMGWGGGAVGDGDVAMGLPQAWPSMDLDEAPAVEPWWRQPYCD